MKTIYPIVCQQVIHQIQDSVTGGPTEYPATTSDMAIQEGWRRAEHESLDCVHVEIQPVWLCPNCVYRFGEYLQDEEHQKELDFFVHYAYAQEGLSSRTAKERENLRRAFGDNLFTMRKYYSRWREDLS